MLSQPQGPRPRVPTVSDASFDTAISLFVLAKPNADASVSSWPWPPSPLQQQPFMQQQQQHQQQPQPQGNPLVSEIIRLPASIQQQQQPPQQQQQQEWQGTSASEMARGIKI